MPGGIIIGCRRRPDGGEKKLLSVEQVRQFVKNGYLVLPIDEVSPGVHRRIYDHALVNQNGSVFNSNQRAEEEPPPTKILTREQERQFASDYFEGVARSPTIMGAMHSLLGPDFCGSARRLQGVEGAVVLPNALVSSTGDNQHHKDGTPHPIREHRFRSVGYWYYPHAVDVVMGPTCILPRSHFWAVDRNTFPHSEERLDMALLPPMPLEQWRHALMGWNGFALSMHSDSPLDPRTGRPVSGEVPAPERDARISAGRPMLGDPKLLEQSLHEGGEVKLTVPAGSVVIKHNDLWHRVSRAGEDGISNEGVPWRPMFSGVSQLFSPSVPPPCKIHTVLV